MSAAERYRHVLRQWVSDRRPRAGETVVAVRIDGEPTLCLLFDSSDLVGCWPHDVPAATVRLSVSTAAVDEVRSRVTSGSAASMSGGLVVDGDRSALGRIAGVAGGSRFRSYLAGIAEPLEGGRFGAGPGLVAVLGAPNDSSGDLSRVAMDRCAAGVDACRRSPPAGLVLCGGFGAHFNTTSVPHWKHCENWLARRFSAHRPRVVGCLESRHTYDDVLLLRELARSLGPRGVTVVTSDYHAARARFLLDLVLPGAVVPAVAHDGLTAGERDRFRRHEEEALARTVAATLLFGVDRLPDGVQRVPGGGRLVLRLPTP